MKLIITFVLFVATSAWATQLEFVGVVGNSSAIHSTVGRRGGGVVVDSQGRIFTGGGDRVLILDADGKLLGEIKLPKSGWVLGGPTFAVSGKYLYFLAGEPVAWEKRYYQASWTMVEPNLCRVEMLPGAPAEVVVTADKFKDYTKMDVTVTADEHSVFVGYTTSWESPGSYSVFEVTPTGDLQLLFSSPVVNGRVSVDEHGDFYLGGNNQIQKVDRQGRPATGFTTTHYPDFSAAGTFFAGAVMLTRDTIWEMGGYGWLARYTRDFKPNPGVVAQHLHALGVTAQVADGPAGTYYIKSPDALYQARIQNDQLTLLRRFGSLPEVLGLALTANGYVGAGYGDTMLWFDFDNPEPAAPPVRGQYYGPVAQGFAADDGWVSISARGWPTDYHPPYKGIALVRFVPEPFTFEGNTYANLGAGEFDGQITALARVGKFYFAVDAKSHRRVRSTEQEPCAFVAAGNAAGSICSVGTNLLLTGEVGVIECHAVTAEGSLKPVWQLRDLGRELYLAAAGNELLVADTEHHRVLLFGFDNDLAKAPVLQCQFNDAARLNTPTLVSINGSKAAVYDAGHQCVVKLRIR